jgi:hypothetical protein
VCWNFPFCKKLSTQESDQIWRQINAARSVCDRANSMLYLGVNERENLLQRSTSLAPPNSAWKASVLRNWLTQTDWNATVVQFVLAPNLIYWHLVPLLDHLCFNPTLGASSLMDCTCFFHLSFCLRFFGLNLSVIIASSRQLRSFTIGDFWTWFIARKLYGDIRELLAWFYLLIFWCF